MSFNNKTNKSLDDLHEEDHFEEMYDSAAQSQAEQDFVASEGVPVAEANDSETRRKVSYWDNIESDDIDDGMDSKWDRFKS